MRKDKYKYGIIRIFDMRIILLLTLIGFSVAAKGQFYTIQPEKKVNTVDERMAEQAVALPQSKKTEEKEIEEYFWPKGDCPWRADAAA